MSRQVVGKSPVHDRALELLRAGMTTMDVGIAVGIPGHTIKVWARKAGIPVRKATMEERAARQAKLDRTRKAREAHRMGITAEKRRRW